MKGLKLALPGRSLLIAFCGHRRRYERTCLAGDPRQFWFPVTGHSQMTAPGPKPLVTATAGSKRCLAKISCAPLLPRNFENRLAVTFSGKSWLTAVDYLQ